MEEAKRIVKETVERVLNNIYEHDNMNDFEKGFNIATVQVANEFARALGNKIKELEVKINKLEEDLSWYQDMTSNVMLLISNNSLGYPHYNFEVYETMLRENFVNVRDINMYLEDMTGMEIEDFKKYLKNIFTTTELEIDEDLVKDFLDWVEEEIN